MLGSAAATRHDLKLPNKDRPFHERYMSGAVRRRAQSTDLRRVRCAIAGRQQRPGAQQKRLPRQCCAFISASFYIDSSIAPADSCVHIGRLHDSFEHANRIVVRCSRMHLGHTPGPAERDFLRNCPVDTSRIHGTLVGAARAPREAMRVYHRTYGGCSKYGRVVGPRKIAAAAAAQRRRARIAGGVSNDLDHIAVNALANQLFEEDSLLLYKACGYDARKTGRVLCQDALLGRGVANQWTKPLGKAADWSDFIMVIQTPEQALWLDLYSRYGVAMDSMAAVGGRRTGYKLSRLFVTDERGVALLVASAIISRENSSLLRVRTVRMTMHHHYTCH